MIELITALNTLTVPGAIVLCALCILAGWVAFLIWGL